MTFEVQVDGSLWPVQTNAERSPWNHRILFGANTIMRHMNYVPACNHLSTRQLRVKEALESLGCKNGIDFWLVPNNDEWYSKESDTAFHVYMLTLDWLIQAKLAETPLPFYLGIETRNDNNNGSIENILDGSQGNT